MGDNRDSFRLARGFGRTAIQSSIITSNEHKEPSEVAPPVQLTKKHKKSKTVKKDKSDKVNKQTPTEEIAKHIQPLEAVIEASQSETVAPPVQVKQKSSKRKKKDKSDHVIEETPPEKIAKHVNLEQSVTPTKHIEATNQQADNVSVKKSRKKRLTILEEQNKIASKPVDSVMIETTSKKTSEPVHSKYKGPNQKYVLFVGNLPYNTTAEELKLHFSGSGDIQNIRIPTDKVTSKPKGFAFIEVGDSTSFERTIGMHHSTFKDRQINVEWTFPGGKNSQKRRQVINYKCRKLHNLSKTGKLGKASKNKAKRKRRHVNHKNV